MELDADIIIRLMGVGASSLLLIVLLTGSIRQSLKIPLVGLVVGGAAYLINTSGIMDRGTPFLMFIDLVSLITPFWIWLFARRLFERETPNWSLVLIGTIYLIGWVLAMTVDVGSGPGFYIIHVISLVLIIDLIYVALSGLGDDLVSGRRLIRIYLPILIGLQSGGILLYELVFGNFSSPFIIQITNASLIYLLILFGGIALLKTNPELLVATDDQKIASLDKLKLSPSEIVLHEKLQTAMHEGRYREPGLTIKSLAQYLGTPEHRLRALINQKLGHRNFSSFLNGYRIKEASEKLGNRELVDLPILTIAMDLGYNSLAPFNRAFRAETGKTPSDFRKSSIDQN
ncbi:MAG: helix-turn-helix domain-containing protein [Parasphingorhabdus sp.]